MRNTDQEEKTIKTLQLDKILHQLSALTCCEDAARMALEIKPVTDAGNAEAQLQKTDDAFTLCARYGNPYFIRFDDLRPDIKRASAGAVLSGRELLNISAVLEQVKMLKNWKKQGEGTKTSLCGYFDNLVLFTETYNAIRSAIISEDEIDDNASEQLASIRRKITRAESRVRELLEKMTRSASTQKYLMEPIVTMREGRFVVPVKSEYRVNVPGLVHDSSSSGATLFIEPTAVVEANNEIRILHKEEQSEIQRILAELSAMCADNAEGIINNYSLVLMLNLYFAKAYLAEKHNAAKPVISKKNRIELKKARHPLINPAEVVPIDISLGGRFWGMIITGPNTGGKTVTLKTLGLLTLMAQCGLLIPAAEGSEVVVFNNILADIGDEQSIEQNLSTFSAHITNIIEIMKVADGSSLVLLDELGSGTDPTEGAALAIAIIEELKRKGCLMSATTHYAELKMYALNSAGIENASCEFDIASLKPTYRLLIGAPGRSNAFAISQRLGMEQDVLKKAKEFISSESRQFDDVVQNLEQSRQSYEKELSEIKRKNQEIEKMKNEIAVLKSTIEKDKERALSGADEKARRIIQTVQAQANAIIDELEDIRKQKDKPNFELLAAAAKNQLKGKIDKLYDEAAVKKQTSGENYALPRPLKIGDEVLIADINQKGVVLSLRDNAGFCRIQAGIMKIKTEEKKLRLIEKPTLKKQSGFVQKQMVSAAEKSIAGDLDLRGQSSEEALLDLDRYIDSCVTSGISQIHIIHGKGTGTLRSAVSRHLKSHPSIKSHRLGRYGEGENGVTVAEIK
ncbi:MAG: endonuclease MutS2 [Oscillospiraceae bacterium]|nr:endonuclease MutS2 [Oscillospiraceae bacterium]